MEEIEKEEIEQEKAQKQEFKKTEQFQIERAILTKYRKKIFRPFCKALDKYELLEEGDKIAVCISGGKDSFLLAKLMQHIQKYGNKKIELKFICMNPGYSNETLNIIDSLAKRLGLELEYYNTNIFNIVQTQKKGACYLCAKMRRGALYEIAEKSKCNKIALGHHFTDVVVTTLMNIFYGSEFKTMMPKLKSDNFKGLELIRPMFLIHEDDIIRWRNEFNLNFIHCACPISDFKIANHEEEHSKRDEIKNLIKMLKKTNPAIEKRIFKSAENINLDASIAWKYKNKRYTFLDEYKGK